MTRPGHGPEGAQGTNFTEFVRHALHAAADQLEPGADGLERIREKIRSRPAYATATQSRKAAILGIPRRPARPLARAADQARRAVGPQGAGPVPRAAGAASVRRLA